MQNRQMQRHDAILSVTLYHRDTPIVVCDTKNICSQGLFIETGPVVYPDKKQLKIGFNADFNGQSKLFRLPVTIIHENNNGLGLKFSRLVDEQDVMAHVLLGYVSRIQQTENARPQMLGCT